MNFHPGVKPKAVCLLLTLLIVDETHSDLESLLNNISQPRYQGCVMSQ